MYKFELTTRHTQEPSKRHCAQWVCATCAGRPRPDTTSEHCFDTCPPRDSDVLPAALAAQTRLQMQRGDTITGSRPTTGPLAQTLRFQSERRIIPLATVPSPVGLVSDREILHTGQVLSAPRLAISLDVAAASAMCPALQRSDVVLPDSTPGLSMSSRETRVLSEAAHAQPLERFAGGLAGPHPLVLPLSPFFSTMLICLMVKRARNPNHRAIRDRVQMPGLTLLSLWPTLGSVTLCLS